MKVLVAMSGGVDSSVAAALLVAQGHDVTGATLRLWGGESDSGCCSVADVDDARRVAQVLGVVHHVFNYAEEFNDAVVSPFVDAHRQGLTPNPCVECNRSIKFDLLFDRAARLGFEAVATGHHARVIVRNGQPSIARGHDANKDQSYVLGFTPRDTVARLLLPVGDLTKEQVRNAAADAGLRTWDKPDSQDVCFIDARGRESFLRDRLDVTPASVIDAVTGQVLDTVAAGELVTVGQRRGIVPGRDGTRRYVKRVDLVNHRVEVDVLESVLIDRVSFAAASLVLHEPIAEGARVLVQASAHGRALAATFTSDGVQLATPTRPIAPGQVIVLYEPENEVVVGAAYAGRS